jgi:hypothetical protein
MLDELEEMQLQEAKPGMLVLTCFSETYSRGGLRIRKPHFGGFEFSSP